MESMTVSGQMYVMCNNLSFNNLAMTRVLFFNKTRYADQQEDAQMLDIIHDNMIISFSYLYSDGVSSYNALFDSIYRASGINTDVASWAAKREKTNLKRLGALHVLLSMS